MAARKKAPSTSAPGGEHTFAVVVEQLRGEFKVFGEALGGLRQQMTDGFEAVDRRFARVEHELGEVKRDLGDMKVDLALVKSAATTHGRELEDIAAPS